MDQAWIALEWARVHEPIDRDMALLEYARIYNEPSYESFMPVRNSALASAMLYATEVGSPKLSFIDAKRFIFAPDLFGHVVGIDTQQALDALKSDEDLRLLASIGLNLSSGGMLSSAREYRLQVESLLLKSEHLLYQLYEKDTSIDFIPIVAQQRLGQDSSIQKQFEEIFAQANSILTDLPANIARRNAYVSDILYTLNYLQRLYTQFVFIGYDALPPLDTSRQLLNSYVITHQDDHSFAAQRSNVILASSNYRYACALVIRDELDGQEQSVDSRIIRSLLDDIRQLSETDIEAGKSLLADAAKRPYLPCSYASVVIGTVYDPSFADFLVDEVGTWSRDQFMTPNDGASI